MPQACEASLSLFIRPPSSRLTQSRCPQEPKPHDEAARAMGKGKRVAPTLPMLSLVALIMLLVAGLSAAAASGDTGVVIRLPSDAAASGDARAGEATARAMPGDYAERPWKCCDMQVCTLSVVLPSCWCHDRLERCSLACKECSKVRGSDPPRYVCKDMYRGEPAPMCTTHA
ncbi:Bowman-Birk type bran trypsin inhibitor [Setaria italica]|nr:Bowman-Birk type bran trypsin inhibitor [Setaria italica]